MNTQLIGSAITILILLATMVEVALEMLKPAFSKIKDDQWRTSANILASLVIGVILAFVFSFNLTTYLPYLLLPFWAGFVIMGLLSAAGSRFWHSILDLIIKLTAMASANVTKVQNTATQEETIKRTSSQTTPVAPVVDSTESAVIVPPTPPVAG
jgi:uncharacterized protein YacL